RERRAVPVEPCTEVLLNSIPEVGAARAQEWVDVDDWRIGGRGARGAGIALVALRARCASIALLTLVALRARRSVGAVAAVCSGRARVALRSRGTGVALVPLR